MKLLSNARYRTSHAAVCWGLISVPEPGLNTAEIMKLTTKQIETDCQVSDLKESVRLKRRK